MLPRLSLPALARAWGAPLLVPVTVYKPFQPGAASLLSFYRMAASSLRVLVPWSDMQCSCIAVHCLPWPGATLASVPILSQRSVSGLLPCCIWLHVAASINGTMQSFL